MLHFSKERRRWALIAALLTLVTMPLALIDTPVALAAGMRAPTPHVALPTSSTSDWPTYLANPARTSNSSETLLNAGNIASLTKMWATKLGGPIAAQPVVAGGVVYVGAWDGNMYALDAGTGAIKWKTFLGQTTTPLCDPTTIGITSTATVYNGIVYVGGGDSNWYALDATTGAILWSVPTGDNSQTGGHYNWSSPLIYNNYAYIGVASNCDNPLVQGQLLQVDLTSHSIVNTLPLVPSGQVGGGLWGSPAVDSATNTLYIAVGNRNQMNQPLAQSVIALDAGTLAVKAEWTIPDADAVVDSDFGSTPIIFNDANGRQWLAVPNKDGYLYVFDRTNLAAGPVWKTLVALGGSCPDCGDGSISPATFANNTLYAAGGNTVINGTGYLGSVRAFDPATGTVLWQHGSPGPILGALTTVNGLVIDTSGSTLEVLDGATGTRLASFTAPASIYDAASISQGTIFVGSISGTLYALAPGNVITPPADASCPSGWICQDIGAPSPSGFETVSSSTWSISAGGVGLAAGTDQLRLMAQSVTGDTQMTARYTGGTAHLAGLMIRQSNDPAAPFYGIFANGTTVSVQYRTQYGGAVTTANQLTSVASPVYLSIIRTGDAFWSATSTDGTNYTLVPGGMVSPLALPATTLVGMAVASGINGTAGTAGFTSVAIGAPGAIPPSPPSASPCPTNWICQDVGDPLYSGDQALSSGTWTISGAGSGMDYTSDQFHYVYQPAPGDATLSAQITGQQNTNNNAEAGIMLRADATPGAAYYAILNTPGGGLEEAYRQQGGLRVFTQALSGTLPAYVEIQRSGATFTAWTSPDGTTWSYIGGSNITLNASGGMLAGMAVTSHVTTTVGSATFANVTLTQSAPPSPVVCPSGWNCADIGYPQPAGSQSLAGTTWTILAGGSDIFATSDAFRYVWQTMPGDGAFSALITAQANTMDWAKAGVMIRASSAANAAYYALLVTPSHGLVVQYRTSTGAYAGQAAAITGSVPVYVQVARAGNIFTAYTSTDGSNWTAIPNSTVSITMPSTALAGMAVTSHNDGTLGSASFDKVVITPGCPTGWNCADIGAPALTGGNTLINGTWTISGGGTDIWGTSDQFHYVWQSLSGDGSINARVATQTNSDVNAKAGLMYRLTTDPGSPYYAIYVTPGNGLAVQYRVSQSANAGQAATLAGTVPAYLKISRTGSTFTAYTSSDGTTWTAVSGSTITLQVSGAMLAGMAVTGHSATILGTATFDHVSLTTPPPLTCPSGWTCADIGSPAIPGNQSLTNGVWTVQGNGQDIWGTSDQFHYVYQSVAGDATLTARITAQANTSAWAKAGLMFRQTTDPGAPYYALEMTPGNGIVVQYRTTQGAYTGQAAILAGTVPMWLRISRAANAFTAYTSPDGVNWTQIPNATKTIGVSGAFLLGFAVTSHNLSRIGSATFDNASLTTPPPVVCPAAWTCADIGSPIIAGGETLNNGVWTISGGGTDIFGTSDQFHYVYQTTAGDNALSAEFTAQTDTSAWAKAGLMFRLSTDPAAPYYAVYVTPGNGYVVQYRNAQGAFASTAGSVTGGKLPVYLRVVRSATTFTAYTSPDGVNWTLIPNSSHTLSALSGTLLIGLAITSHNQSALGSATLNAVTFAAATNIALHRRPHVNPRLVRHGDMEGAV
jgi:outer membrane protein assembly factor BamB